jgi:hypothetical protein
MAADLADSPVTVNVLLPGGATDTGMIPDDTPAETRERPLDPAITGPRSSGSPRRRRPGSTTSGSSPSSPSTGWPRDERLGARSSASRASRRVRPTAPAAILAPCCNPCEREAARLCGVTPTHDHLRMRLVVIAVATVFLDAAASVIVFLFERDADGTAITTLGDSVFWTSTQLLTVSSQLPNPISTPARVFDIFLQAYAITVVAMLAGSFGAFFHRRGIERDPLDSSAGA